MRLIQDDVFSTVFGVPGIQLMDESHPESSGAWRRYHRKHHQEAAKCSKHSKLVKNAHLSLSVHLGIRTLEVEK